MDTCGDACWWEYAAGDLSPQLQKPYKNMCRHLLCAGTNLIYMFTMDVYIYVYNYIYIHMSCLVFVLCLFCECVAPRLSKAEEPTALNAETCQEM